MKNLSSTSFSNESSCPCLCVFLLLFYVYYKIPQIFLDIFQFKKANTWMGQVQQEIKEHMTMIMVANI